MDTAKTREVFFNNLMILGLDKAAIEKKCRVVINKDMFCVPNQKKLFEEVTNFLFMKLNQTSKQKYVLPWPVLAKDQQRQFQKAVFNHLSAIALESNVVFPHLVSSMLSTFSGDRFYELYLAFSTHVLQRTLGTKKNVSLVTPPKLDAQNNQDVAEILRIGTILSIEKFQEVQSFSVKHLKSVFKCAEEFVDEIQNLKLKLSSNGSLFNKNNNVLSTLYCDTTESSSHSAIKKSIDYDKKVKALWISFDTFLAKERELWKLVCSQVGENPATFCVDGSNLINFVASDDIKKICPELNRVSNVVGEEKGKPSLLKYLKSLCILLECYLKTYVNSELSQVNELCYRKNISGLEENLNHIKSLNENLATKVLPSMKENTKNFLEKLYLPEDSEEMEDFARQHPSFNCCSTKFQEQIISSQAQMFSSMPLSGDTCDSSLLLGGFTKFLEDVSTESRSSALSRSAAQQSNSFLASSFPVTELHQLNTLPNNEKLSDETQHTIQGNKSELNLSLGLNFQYLTTSSEKICQNLIPETTIKPNGQDPHIFVSASSIEDFEIDIEYKKPYKLRESWQLEDSLNAMTLPDMDELE